MILRHARGGGEQHGLCCEEVDVFRAVMAWAKLRLTVEAAREKEAIEKLRVELQKDLDLRKKARAARAARGCLSTG